MLVQTKLWIDRDGVVVAGGVDRYGILVGLTFGRLGRAPTVWASWYYRFLRVWRLIVSQWIPEEH